MRAWILIVLAAGCGHAASSTRSAKSPAAPPAYRIVEMQKHDYRLGSGCGSGPFDFVLDLPRLRGMSRVRIYSVGKHALPLRFEVGAAAFTTWIYKNPPDDRCHLRTGEVVALPVAESASARKESPPPVAAAAKPPRLATTALPAATTAPLPALLSGQTFLQGELYLTDGESQNIPDLEGAGCWSLRPAPAAPLHTQMWLTSVQHLDDAALRVVVEAIVPLNSGADFELRVANRIANDRALATSRAAVCREKPNDPQCFIGCERANERSGTFGPVLGPPPTPPLESPPARPRADAEWIAGSWRWTGAKYEWDRGFWRLSEPPPPAASVAAARFATGAPRPAISPALPARPAVGPAIAAPPPLPPAATPPPPPSSGVLWVPGYWSWSGAAWSFVAGAWRVPPSPTARFVPPRVVAAPGGVRIDSGRWVIVPR